ncbi:hypothetical protein DR999_PMT19869 [Platysternon megacephalum]|uniref:Uncharacterized protein n=1 Tax=Platysternon megacephalum TaxID=55544 RepID=A0A4D9DPP1_9SAUR|nr:hypothetical protein DR999_PMT19869 [Platysternon megacephalum]
MELGGSGVRRTGPMAGLQGIRNREGPWVMCLKPGRGHPGPSPAEHAGWSRSQLGRSGDAGCLQLVLFLLLALVERSSGPSDSRYRSVRKSQVILSQVEGAPTSAL